MDFVQGLGAGLLSGAWGTLQGLADLAVNALVHPIDTFNGLTGGLEQMLGVIVNRDGRGFLQAVLPDAVELYDNYYFLNAYQKGELVGKVIGNVVAQVGIAYVTAGVGNAIAA